MKTVNLDEVQTIQAADLTVGMIKVDRSSDFRKCWLGAEVVAVTPYLQHKVMVTYSLTHDGGVNTYDRAYYLTSNVRVYVPPARRARRSPSMVRLHKVRAGWYETTTGDPVCGTLVVSVQEDSEGRPYWNLARYELDEENGDVELISTGDTFNTLRDARYFITNHHNEGAAA